WMQPTGAEAYLQPKELTPLGPHRLDGIWEDTVGPAMERYLVNRQVQFSIMHPLRLGMAGQSSPPAFIMIGVNPDSVSPEFGLELAIHCRFILLDHQIEDVHVIIYESQYRLLAKLYKPAITANPVAVVREPFSTTLGVPICNPETPNCEGTGGLFFIDPAKPGKLFLLTARHVLFNPDTEENVFYRFCEDSGVAKQKVIVMGEGSFKRRCSAIEGAISDKEVIIEQLQRRMEATANLDEEDAALEREAVEDLTNKAQKALTALKKLLAEILQDWTDEENRVIGHVTLSPPISTNHADGGFTEDWAVIEVDPSMISRLSFGGNAIDLGSIAVDRLTAWMDPAAQPANPTRGAFKYPGDRLLRFSGTVSDEEMYKPSSEARTEGLEDNVPLSLRMVLKNGNTTDLTVGRLNTIRAFTGKPGAMSKELAVLPRGSTSGPFAAKGDSGSVVVDAKGRVCGLVTGGDGDVDVSDCAFLTSIDFVVRRLLSCGIRANIFPLPTDL
ncbi:hypothetical protein C8Q73DRAFT_657226, partial [Cubamyces lactineus]